MKWVMTSLEHNLQCSQLYLSTCLTIKKQGYNYEWELAQAMGHVEIALNRYYGVSRLVQQLKDM